MSIVTESLFPRFVEPVTNVTVTVGRDALLACVVEDLRGYKVNKQLCTKNIVSKYNVDM